MTDYPTISDKLATLRHAIEEGVKADTMQALKLCELVDEIAVDVKAEREACDVPEGWKLVPIVPQRGMTGAGGMLPRGEAQFYHPVIGKPERIEVIGFSKAHEVWMAMLDAAPVAPAVAALTYPAEFTDELQWILGLLCFQCITYAQTLRAAGRDIPNKAEAEQAATLDWMLRHYLRDPENWRTTAVAEMRAMRAAASSAGDQA